MGFSHLITPCHCLTEPKVPPTGLDLPVVQRRPLHVPNRWQKRFACLPSPIRISRLVQLTAASEVRRVNSGTITRADGQLYAPFNLGAVKKLFDAVSSQTKRPRRVLLKHGHVVEE